MSKTMNKFLQDLENPRHEEIERLKAVIAEQLEQTHRKNTVIADLKDKVRWQAEMLERARPIAKSLAHLWSKSVNDADEWLDDLEKGPTDERG